MFNDVSLNRLIYIYKHHESGKVLMMCSLSVIVFQKSLSQEITILLTAHAHRVLGLSNYSKYKELCQELEQVRGLMKESIILVMMMCSLSVTLFQKPLYREYRVWVI